MAVIVEKIWNMDENCPFSSEDKKQLVKTVIFHSYVKLPHGKCQKGWWSNSDFWIIASTK